MLTGKAAGQLGENGNDAPGKRESRVEENEDGKAKNEGCAFCLFLPSALEKNSLGAAVVRSESWSRARRSRAQWSEAERRAERPLTG